MRKGFPVLGVTIKMLTPKCLLNYFCCNLQNTRNIILASMGDGGLLLLIRFDNFIKNKKNTENFEGPGSGRN